VPQLRAQARAFADGINSTYANLDGTDLEIFRTKSPTLDYAVPHENSIYAYFGLIGSQFEGRVKPSVADGDWVSIPPLPPGTHILTFGGSKTGAGFGLNVLYFLSIEWGRQTGPYWSRHRSRPDDRSQRAHGADR
jgi:hypothetical protein